MKTAIDLFIEDVMQAALNQDKHQLSMFLSNGEFSLAVIDQSGFNAAMRLAYDYEPQAALWLVRQSRGKLSIEDCACGALAPCHLELFEVFNSRIPFERRNDDRLALYSDGEFYRLLTAETLNFEKLAAKAAEYKQCSLANHYKQQDIQNLAPTSLPTFDRYSNGVKSQLAQRDAEELEVPVAAPRVQYPRI